MSNYVPYAEITVALHQYAAGCTTYVVDPGDSGTEWGRGQGQIIQREDGGKIGSREK